MSKLFSMASVNNEFIRDNYKERKRDYVLSLIFSFIICVSPVLLLINLSINLDLILYIVSGIAVMAFIFLFLTDVIFYNAVKKMIPGMKIKYNLLVSLIQNSIIIVILYLISLLIVGVIFIW